MPTDHACQTAAELVAHSLQPLREHLGASPGHGGPADGAAGLLTFLDGLYAELHGALTDWHSTAGARIRDALGLPPPGSEGIVPPARPRPSGWEALNLVRHRSEEILTALSVRSRGEAVGAEELLRRLELVEDALAGALRRLGVPAQESVHYAAELAAATGSLFGMRPAPRPPAPGPPPAPARPQPPAAPFATLPQMSTWSQGGMP
ncbi:hypothetical protein [Streptomyces thermoalcalitolerans]|uniref:Uncharacterized protein n=1 Tax=Streptomyces thermoalcalitolerans TaxID=65605 RepID=A0ABN1NP81_9ACTN